MKLYFSGNSPYARKVRVVAIELEVFEQLELVDINPRDPSTGLWELNALGKVPTLVLDDGTVIHDSPVICEYLNAAHGGGRLLPAGEAAWRTRTLVSLADGIMDAGMAARLEGMRPPQEQSASWVEKQLAAADRGFAALEDVVDELDAQVDLASIAAACTVFWIGFRHPGRDWLDGRPRLAECYQRFAERPSMKRTAPEGT